MTRKRMIVEGQHPRTWDDGNADPWFYGVILHEPRDVGMRYAPDVIRVDDNGDSVLSRLGRPVPWNRWFPHTLEINKNNPGAGERLMTYEADIFINGGAGGPINTSVPVNALSQDFGGNLFAWDIMRNGRLRMKSYRYDIDGDYPYPRLDPTLHNFDKEPEMYALVTAVNVNGDVILPSGGVIQFMPRVANVERWIDVEKVKLLPGKPKTWTIAHVRRNNEQIIGGKMPT